MEFGLSRAIQLASSSLACLRPARELVADLVSDQSQICRDSSNLVPDRLAAGLRPARELVRYLDSVMKFGFYALSKTLQKKFLSTRFTTLR